MSKIRVLVVDDSLFMRAAIAKTLAADRALRGRRPGQGRPRRRRQGAGAPPDVCTMDFNMPGMNGADAVREIMQRRPTPVVMFSAHTQEGASETFDALAAGAVDFVAKPSGEVSADLAKVGDALRDKLAAAARRQADADGARAPVPPRAPAADRAARPVGVVGPRVVVVGVSTGGPAALGRVFPRFPADTSLALIVVQHLPARFTAALAERLDALCASACAKPPTATARGGAGAHRPWRSSPRGAAGRHAAHRRSPRSTACARRRTSPCAPPPPLYGRRVVGVVMTGMGKDGAEGMRAIKSAGGATLVQDEASSVIWGMPRACIDAGCADRVVPLDALADAVRTA